MKYYIIGGIVLVLIGIYYKYKDKIKDKLKLNAKESFG